MNTSLLYVHETVSDFRGKLGKTLV